MAWEARKGSYNRYFLYPINAKNHGLHNHCKQYSTKKSVISVCLRCTKHKLSIESSSCSFHNEWTKTHNAQIAICQEAIGLYKFVIVPSNSWSSRLCYIVLCSVRKLGRTLFSGNLRLRVPQFYHITVSSDNMSKRKISGSDSTGISPRKKQQSLLTFVNRSQPAVPSSPSSANKDFDLVSLVTDVKWRNALRDQFKKKYFQEIEAHLAKAYKENCEIFPQRSLIFNALNLTPLDQIKAVILGQDPYHGVGQAHGLCFSVPRNIYPPPSLQNIYKELAADIPGFRIPKHGCLEAWAKQGVLLLNATLTVIAHNANSHANIGWQLFTDAIIELVNRECSGVVFILWGGFAQKKAKLIDTKRHAVIQAAHPSPLSATKFFGCRCFSKTNAALTAFGKRPIDWTIPE